MSAELRSFIAAKRAKGVPWHHIATMAGKPMASIEPYKALEDGYRASRVKAEAEAIASYAVKMAKRKVPANLVIPPPEMRLVALRIAAEHGVSLDLLTSQVRRKGVNEARQNVMWALLQIPKCSTTMVGAFLGGRDHSTVLYGARRHAERSGLGQGRAAA